MLLSINVDKAIQCMFDNYSDLNGNVIRCMPKEQWVGCSEETKYPIITFIELFQNNDLSRYIPEKEVEVVDGRLLVKNPLLPINLTYQVELIAKTKLDIDVLETIILQSFKLPRDVIHVKASLDDKDSKYIKMPMKQVEYKNLDEIQDNNNKKYRRVYTFEIKTTVDVQNVVQNDYILSTVKIQGGANNGK